MHNPWKTYSSKEIYSNPWITLTEHDVTNPGGGKSIYGKVHYKNLALGIIPLDEELNTWLVGQYRYTLDEYSWEIPMGGGPEGMDKLESAKRELKEETGISADKWTEIIKIHTSNSVTDEVGYAYLAEGLTEGQTSFEETEELEIKKLPLEDAIKMCDAGTITDSLSVAALYKLDRLLKNKG
jgi:8-oxo-dGTP pyrophosphatase MutT (NUDIX family)